MLKKILTMGLLTGVTLSSTLAWSQQLPELKSVNVDLPAGDIQFPGGAAADAINNNCLACHSADMVLNQAGLPRAEWEAEVRKMINVYRAPIDDADVASIVAYLAKNKGVDKAGQ